MSWYTDPQLFIYSSDSVFSIGKVTQGFRTAITIVDEENLSFSKHLSLGSNKESDYDAFKASFPTSGPYLKYTNCQGLVFKCWLEDWTSTLSREEPNSPFWMLPGITRQKQGPEQLALEAKVSDLEATISSLQDQVSNNKAVKEAIDKRVSDVEAENSILRDQVNRERDEKSVLINVLKREDMHARLQVVEKQIKDLTSKLIQS